MSTKDYMLGGVLSLILVTIISVSAYSLLHPLPIDVSNWMWYN
jgi:hypothetical protein